MRPSRVIPGPLLVVVLALGGAAAGPGVEGPTVGGDESTSKIDDETLEWLLELHGSEEEQVRLVLLPTVVTNRKGKIIRGLEADDFSLLEEHVPQEIRYFNTESVEPVSVAFLLDVSGSMRQHGKLDAAKESVRVFVDTLRTGDLFGLICFADDQVVWVTEFTSDRDRFLARLDVQEAYGQTALYDALAATPRLVADEIEGRKAIVLITDGADNASRTNTLSAVQVARRVNVPIYILGFRSVADELLHNMGREKGMPVLERFADETGGSLFSIYDPDDLEESVLRIQEELRFQYLIGYHPERDLWDGSFRRVELRTHTTRHVVRTRSGYYARP